METRESQKEELTKYWTLTPETLADILNTNLTRGLSKDEALKRLRIAGPNQLEAKKQLSALSLFLSQFKSPIILILLFATVVSAVVQSFVDSAIILSIVLLSAILGFFEEYSAGNAVEKLKKRVSVQCRVLREGQEQLVPMEEIVPGDVVFLSAGSLIPGDGVVFEARDLFVNQAVVTGENFPAEKKPGATSAQSSLPERKNVVFMGTSVASGIGKMLVVTTGQRTVLGQIAHQLRLRPPATEFERGIQHLGYFLSEVMFILVLAIFILNLVFHRPILDSLLFSVALAVGLTPQLLPAIIVTNLSKGSRFMAQAGVIVRRLAAIENFGSMNLLCLDKTGTITEGTVKLEGAYDVEGKPSDLVFREAYINARLQSGLINPLDEAIYLSHQMEISNVRKVDEVPYDFERKRLTVVVQEESSTSEALRFITKGALENVLEVSSSFLRGEEVVPLEETALESILTLYRTWSEQGFRVLGVARKEAISGVPCSRESENNMVFIGFLLFFDPPKEGIRDILSELEKMGIRLKIITGDNKFVATHVASSVGIETGKVLSGKELDILSDEALLRAAEAASVFAEVDPRQKQRIIIALKKMGNVVGFMGDGVNDVLALHDADVGISADSAVDVAKEAADFILLQKDLGVLKEGVIQGRRVFANTLKYVFMATSANFGNMFSMAVASLFLPFLPLLPKQILLINLLTDLPEMTIASDQVDKTYIEAPHRWDIGFIRRFMNAFGPLSSLFDFATFGLLLLLRVDQVLFRTGWFVESVLSATTVIFSLRTRLPFFRNAPARALALASIFVIALALWLPYSFMAPIMGFAPLPPRVLAGIAGIVIAYFFSAELVKHFFYR
ncbi:MAG TPA: magnesium-translocating P-type ATPase [Candidatus Atribacteria bacterium]|nr:magnesium-translocating P-type ATPase [Candidatus Atribacteria bacterium]